MQHNLIQVLQRPAQERRGLFADVLVRRAVESVSADLPLVRQVPIDGVGRRRGGQVVEERRVEHRDMRHIRKHLAGHLDTLHGRRIVQRRQLRDLLEFADHRVVDQGRPVERCAAVHHPMANRRQPARLQIDTGVRQLVERHPQRGGVVGDGR